jgi:hypothetical protein
MCTVKVFVAAILMSACLSGCVTTGAPAKGNTTDKKYSGSLRQAGAGSAGIDTNWIKAAQNIRRVPPAEFTAAPRRVTNALKLMGCTIPQVLDEGSRHNLIKGSFARRGQTDWAALCSHQGETSIIVFWSGNPKTISKIGIGQDTDSLQSVGKGKAEFSRVIDTLGINGVNKVVARNKEAWPPITHDAISDTFVGTGTTIFYFYQGKWLEMADFN